MWRSPVSETTEPSKLSWALPRIASLSIFFGDVSSLKGRGLNVGMDHLHLVLEVASASSSSHLNSGAARHKPSCANQKVFLPQTN